MNRSTTITRFTEAGLWDVISLAAKAATSLRSMSSMNRDAVVEQARALMARASREVLGGFELSTDVEIVRYPDRYMDKRGVVMWNTVNELVDAF